MIGFLPRETFILLVMVWHSSTVPKRKGQNYYYFVLNPELYLITESTIPHRLYPTALDRIFCTDSLGLERPQRHVQRQLKTFDAEQSMFFAFQIVKKERRIIQ